MKDHDHNPDPNQNAARIVREATAAKDAIPADLEAAWAAWSAGIQKMDERGMMVEAEEAKLGERLTNYLPCQTKESK
jgi:hypothetical protein